MSNTTQSTSGASPTGPSTKDLLRFEAEKKSAGVALFLCWALGLFGAHRFYMGRSGSGVAMLIVTLVSIPLSFVIIGFFSLFAVAVWVIVDLFSVSGWTREYNTALLTEIQSGHG